MTARHGRRPIRGPVAAPDHDMLDDGKAARRKQGFHDGLIHSDCRCQDSRPDVRHVGQLQQALQRPVLAVGTVHDRKDDIDGHTGDEGALVLSTLGENLASLDRQECLLARSRDQVSFAAGSRGGCRLEMYLLPDDLGSRASRRGEIRDGPPPILVDANRDGFVACPVDVGNHGRRGGQRHLVLAGSPAIDHPNAESFHTRSQGFRRERRVVDVVSGFGFCVRV